MATSTPHRTHRPVFLPLAILGCALATVSSSALQSVNTAASNVFGQTINAITKAPVQRVLVRCGGQAVLTDYQGQFRFDADCPAGLVSAYKPGYFLGEDASGPRTIAAQASLTSQPLLIALYPEAILTGSVITPLGEPLTGVLIVATRSLYDDSGHHWTSAGTTHADAHGEFRLPLTPGDYRVQSTYTSPSMARTQAVLPVMYPGDTSSGTLGLLHLRSGETERIDLHPQLQPVTTVSVSLEPAARRPNISITARQTGGSKITLRPSTATAEGEVKLEIPSGSYTLEALRQTPDGLEQAQTSIIVGAAEMRGVQLRFAPVSPIQIQITSTSNLGPSSASLSWLELENADTSADAEQDVLRPTPRGSQTVFNATPGAYRLRAQSGGPWYVLSATYGMSDLLRQDLVVSAGVAPAIIRVLVSDQTASLSGGIRAGDQAASGYVYLIATSPSATPVVILHADATGKYSRANVPPGSYRVLAFEHRHSINFEDPETLAIFSNAARAVTLNAGDKTSLDLDLTPWPESLQ